MHNVVPPPATCKHILVVDDNETNRKVAERIFLHLGCQLSFAVDGQAAVAAVQQQRFDLVLMDCHMPNLDGIAATKVIRAWEASAARTPTVIVAVSADVAVENRAQCAAAGMDNFIGKPFNLAAAKRLLASPQGGASEPAVAAIQSTPELALLPLNLFAHAQFMEIKQLMGAKLLNLLGKFGVDAVQQLTRMRDAAVACDAENLRHSAHKLKGSSSSLGAYALADHCAELERKAITRQLEDLMPSIAAIDVCYEHTRSALDTYIASLNVPSPAADVGAIERITGR